ncbi:MAG TPA: 2-deoxyribose-5-phosphate aldolase, partial [bacterium]|nr:2-deoxyribose-5-phosphate aldolase [bacterium]
MTRDELLKYIDQTLLKPQATIEELYSFLREAKDYKFYAVCINPWFTRLAVEEMRGTGIKVGIAIGFPLGATTTRTKLYEAEEALDNG